MDHRTFIALILASLVGLALAACGGGSGPSGTGTADLLPIPQISSFNPPSFSFCQRDEENLYVTVKNQGTARAAQSITRIDFGSAGGPFDITTGPLDPSASVVLPQPIPLGCFNADCGFTIIVNHTGTVDEGSGGAGNNEAHGNCIG